MKKALAALAAIVTAAVGCQREAPTASPAREDAYRANNRGVALLEQFNARGAVAEFQRALKLAPQLALAQINLAINNMNGPAYLLRNDGGNASHWIEVKTIGRESNRDGIGARVTVTGPDGTRHWSTVKSGSSYCSQSELPVTFGLGDAQRVTEIRVRWPGGRVDTIAGAAANQAITIQQGKGVIDTRPLRRAQS